MTILYFLIALGLLVFIHEFGHFLAAKFQKIGVEKFSLGFGPKLIGVTKGETTYLISALPMGGYVKLHGEDPEGAKPDDVASYSGRPVGQRARVVFAGPLMNLALALVLMPAVLMIGRTEPQFYRDPPVIGEVEPGSAAAVAGLKPRDRILKIGTHETPDWHEALQQIILRPRERVIVTVERAGKRLEREVWLEADPSHQGGLLGVEPPLFVGQEAVADQVIPGSPAEQGGIRPGDEVLAINGAAIKRWREMAGKIDASDGRPVRLDVRQETTGAASQPIRRVTVTPRFDEGAKRWVIGIQKDFEKRGVPLVKRRYPFLQAVALGFEENWKLGKMTLSVLGRLVTLRLSYKTLGGPVRIAQASASAAKGGIAPFLYFLAFLSLQLGVLNLLPIPVLDGGHLLFMGIEKLLRRPLPMKVRLMAEQAGFVLLVGLMVLVTLHDVDSVWGFRALYETVRGWF